RSSCCVRCRRTTPASAGRTSPARGPCSSGSPGCRAARGWRRRSPTSAPSAEESPPRHGEHGVPRVASSMSRRGRPKAARAAKRPLRTIESNRKQTTLFVCFPVGSIVRSPAASPCLRVSVVISLWVFVLMDSCRYNSRLMNNRLVLGTVLAALAAGCSSAPPRENLPERSTTVDRRAKPDEIVALYNGEPVTWQAVAEKMLELNLKESVDQYVRWRMVEDRKKSLGIVHTPEELRRRAA